MLFLTATILAAATIGWTHGFTSNTCARPNAASSSTTKQQLNAIDASTLDPLMVEDMVAARAAFGLAFFGATGSAGVGRAVIPLTWDRYQDTKALAGTGSTRLGGDDLGIIGYPEPIYSNDVQQILDNTMSMEEIVRTFPIEDRMPGYLTYEAYVKANSDANPVAVRAVFDGFKVGINNNLVAPYVAEEKLNLFREDLGNLKGEVNTGKLVGIAALVCLIGLIGGADYFAFYHGWHGWFPEWPGLDHFPSSLFEQDTGLMAISKYWVDGDLPQL